MIIIKKNWIWEISFLKVVVFLQDRIGWINDDQIWCAEHLELQLWNYDGATPYAKYERNSSQVKFSFAILKKGTKYVFNLIKFWLIFCLFRVKIILWKCTPHRLLKSHLFWLDPSKLDENCYVKFDLQLLDSLLKWNFNFAENLWNACMLEKKRWSLHTIWLGTNKLFVTVGYMKR